MAFEYALEDEVAKCLGAECPAGRDEDFSKDRQQKDRLDKDHDCDGAAQVWQHDIPETFQHWCAVHFCGFQLLAVQRLDRGQQNQRRKRQPLPADNHDE